MAEANRALKKLPEDALLEVEEVASVTAYHVATSAAADVPIGEGRHGKRHDFKTGKTSSGIHLRNAISWKRGKGSATVRVDKEAFYWKYLEYGTVKMRAIGMFRRAGERLRGDHQARLLAGLERANRKMTAGSGS